jgi:predicted phage tail protein
MLRKIKLYGKLAKFIGHRVLEADVASAAEAVRFLVANWPGARSAHGDQHYRVSIGTYDIDLEELHHPAGAAPISFVPVVAGAGAAGRIIVGVLLVAVAIAFPLIGVGAAAIAAGTTVGAVSASIALTGLSLIIGGISQLLTPTPTTSKDEGDPRKSFSFSGIQNTNRAGVPVPVVYGETLVGSVVISAGIDIVQVSA